MHDPELEASSRSSYIHRMSKRAISVTLSPENLLWLQATATRWSRRSLSDTLDGILDDLRGRASVTGARSLFGQLTIDASDPELRGADAAVRRLFAAIPDTASVARDAPAAPSRAARRPPTRRR